MSELKVDKIIIFTLKTIIKINAQKKWVLIKNVKGP
jgi:hypothetical protein